MASLIRQTACSALIFLLLWVFLLLVSNLPPQPPAKLPGSESEVLLYSNQTQDDLTGLYQQAIESAQQSITLAIYNLTDETIIQALRKKTDEGIPVHIVCEATASKEISGRLPKTMVVQRAGEGLMHQKILIVDSNLIVLGSANLTHSSLNIHDNLVIGMNHPPLAHALTKRIKSMDNEGAFTPLLNKETTAGLQNLELWVLPDDQTAANRMINLIRSAKKTIKVAMFTWTRKDFTQELIEAAHRGVKVEAVIDSHQGKGSSAKIVKILEKGGIPVTLSTGQGLLHHKFAYIDETILVNGSANWTHRGFTANDDFFLIIYPLTPEHQLKMNQLWHAIKKQSEKPKAER